MTISAALLHDSGDDLPESLTRTLVSTLDEATRTVNTRAEVRSTKLAAEATQDLIASALTLTPWVSAASITHRASQHRAPTTFGSTSDAATAVDQLQYRSGQGPCIDAIGTTAMATVMTSDLRSDLRWPVLAAEVRSAGLPVRTVVSCSLTLPAGEYGCLNLYGHDLDGTPEDERAQSAQLATAVVAVGFTALLHRRKADNLLQALESSRQIGAALGILMMHHQWTYDHAFLMLRTRSQLLHRKIRDIADDVLFTGDLPPLPAAVRDGAEDGAAG